MKKSTSKDVAQRAGVSQAAVSLILNNSDKVTFSDETRERVIAVAKELGYRLPTRKKTREKQRTNLILVLTPTLENPFYSELISALESYADTLGYRVIVGNTFRKAETERYYLESFAGGRVDGMIYTFLPSFPAMVEQMKLTTPVVIIGEKQDELNICSIELSNNKAGALLAEHLYGLGHRRFAFISTPFNRFTLARGQRLEGMRAALRQYGIGEEALRVVMPEESSERDTGYGNMPYEYRVGRQLVCELLRGGCEATAFIGVNDMAAIGVCDGLREMGFSVPRDYSVCGFDNLFVSSVVSPSVTTIDHCLNARCRAAVDFVLENPAQAARSAPDEPVVNKIEYAPRLILRDSTGPCAQG